MKRSSSAARVLPRVLARRCFPAVIGALLGAAFTSPSRAEDAVARRAPYAAGTTTFCVVDASRGFDEAAGITDGQRIVIVQAWYPVDPRAASDHPVATFADYFAGDRELLLRTERNLLVRSGFAEDVVVATWRSPSRCSTHPAAACSARR